MADASHSDLLAQFTGVTGVDAERAKFYLEAAAWNLDVAMSSFYDEGDNMGEEDVAEPAPAAPAPATDPQRISPPPRVAQPKSRFGTISNLKPEDSESSSEEEGQAFYAGGSERSGQQVLGPPRKKQSADKLVDTMFKAAKEHGAETVEESTSLHTNKASSFRGAGYRLGESDTAPSDLIMGDPVNQPTSMAVVLKLWKNGFSIDDGELRDYQDPANKDFLQAIHRGEVPRELLRMAKGGEVNLNMEDHRNEEFAAPKRSVKAFSGEGHMLGSPSPNVVGAAAASASASAGSSKQAEASAKASVSVDESQPTTNIQIRLADGSRLVSKFNHTHQISDVRNYIVNARPQFAGANFVLMTAFPSKELSDESQTLSGAQLLNAVIIQRLK